MRIGIITLHRAFNYGAYLQAYALAKYIKSLGCEPHMIDVGGYSALKKRMRTLVSKSPRRLAFNFKKYRVFRDAWGSLPPSGSLSEQYDAVIAGSDEIWSVNNVTFHSSPAFFGIGVNAKKKLSYAPSVGQSTSTDLFKHSYVVNGLRSLDSVSARDEATEAAVLDLTGKKPVRVLDPTFLVDWLSEVSKPADSENTLLIYSYTFNEQKKAIAQEFARQKGLRIISPGFYNSWCDQIEAVSPIEFLNSMRAAKYVLTDTFHGTIFSVILQKNFATFSSGKMKLISLLKDLEIGDRDISDGRNIDQILSSKPDYRKVNSIIDSKRELSIAYLKHALLSSN